MRGAHCTAALHATKSVSLKIALRDESMRTKPISLDMEEAVFLIYFLNVFTLTISVLRSTINKLKNLYKLWPAWHIKL